MLNTSNSKEKNIITVDLTNDEKYVFSQLGINPLITLGREYLTSNNFVLLKDNKEEKGTKLENKIENINKKADDDGIDQSIQKNNETEEVLIVDNNDEIELTDEVNNARKKRRRSSASIE